MVTLADDTDVQPIEFVTVNVYVPEEMTETIVVLPVPVVVIPPGVRVNVQVPVAGKPFKITLPIAREHVGWVTVPMDGAAGVSGGAFITMFADGEEVHPAALVTVQAYVPGASPEMVELVPVPVVVIPPGFLVNVHVPV
jgi:hypothetical protein